MVLCGYLSGNAAMSARDRVRVLLSVMGAQTSVLIHERDLAPVRVSAPLASKGAVRGH